MNWFTAILTGLFLLVIFYFILVWSYKINTRKLRKRYKEDEDLSKHGEKRRKKLGTRESGIKGVSNFGFRDNLQAKHVNMPTGHIQEDRNINKVDSLFRNIRRQS